MERSLKIAQLIERDQTEISTIIGFGDLIRSQAEVCDLLKGMNFANTIVFSDEEGMVLFKRYSQITLLTELVS